jgi:ParB/RepB/Spo0J family partition protein
MGKEFLKSSNVINKKPDSLHERIFEEILVSSLVSYDQHVRINEDDLDYQRGIDDLAQNIEKHGLLSPIVVIGLIDDDTQKTEYIPVAGSRRIAALKKLKRLRIPANVYYLKKNDPDVRKKMFLITDSENVKRENIIPIEDIKSIGHMIRDLKMSVEEVMQHRAVSEQHIKNIMTCFNALPLLETALEKYNVPLTKILSIRKFFELVPAVRANDKEKMEKILSDMQFAKDNDRSKRDSDNQNPSNSSRQSIKSKENGYVSSHGNILLNMKNPQKVIIDYRKATHPGYHKFVNGLIHLSLAYDGNGKLTEYLSDDNKINDMLKKINNEIGRIVKEIESKID